MMAYNLCLSQRICSVMRWQVSEPLLHPPQLVQSLFYSSSGYQTLLAQTLKFLVLVLIFCGWSSLTKLLDSACCRKSVLQTPEHMLAWAACKPKISDIWIRLWNPQSVFNINIYRERVNGKRNAPFQAFREGILDTHTQCFEDLEEEDVNACLLSPSCPTPLRAEKPTFLLAIRFTNSTI